MATHLRKVVNGKVIVLLLVVVVAIGFKIGWFWAGLICAGLLLAFQDGYDSGLEEGRNEATDDHQQPTQHGEHGRQPAARAEG